MSREVHKRDFVEVRRIALSIAHKLVGSDYADDIAQEACLLFLEGHGKKKMIRHAVIDSIRKIYGDDRNETHWLRVNERHGGNPLYQIAAPKVNLDGARILAGLRGPARVAATLYFKWGFDMMEIAEVLGVVESRISQIVKKVREQAKAEKLATDAEMDDLIASAKARNQVQEHGGNPVPTDPEALRGDGDSAASEGGGPRPDRVYTRMADCFGAEGTGW